MIRKELIWGIGMIAVGGGAFLWSAQDSLFSREPLPEPSPVVVSTLKPSFSPASFFPEDASDRVQYAQRALENGQIEYAISTLEDIETPESQSLLLQAFLQQKSYLDAQEILEQLLSLSYNEEYQRDYVSVLLLQAKLDESSLALQLLNDSAEKSFYELLIAVMDKDHEVVEQLAKKLQQDEEYKTIGNAFIDVYTTYESFRDGSPHYLNTLLANLLKTLEFHHLAIEYIKPTLKEFPEYRDAWLVIGNAYLELKKFEIAERMFEKALSLDPTHPITPYLLGVTLYELGQTEDALDQLKNAKKNGFEPKSQINRVIGDIYFSDEKFDEALEYYQVLLSDSENASFQDFSKGIYIALQELDAPILGRSFAEKAKLLFQNSPEVMALEGWVLLREGQPEKSQILLEELKNQYPDTPDVLLYLGRTYEFQERFDPAFDTYKQCYEMIPLHPVSLECGERYEDLRERLQNGTR